MTKFWVFAVCGWILQLHYPAVLRGRNGSIPGGVGARPRFFRRRDSHDGHRYLCHWPHSEGPI